MNSIQMNEFVLTFEYTDIEKAAKLLVKRYPKQLADNSRVGRAINYVRNGRMEWMGKGLYKAHSETGEREYTVNLAAEKWNDRCTCPDNQKEGNVCKHRIAAMLIETMK